MVAAVQVDIEQEGIDLAGIEQEGTVHKDIGLPKTYIVYYYTSHKNNCRPKWRRA